MGASLSSYDEDTRGPRGSGGDEGTRGPKRSPTLMPGKPPKRHNPSRRQRSVLAPVEAAGSSLPPPGRAHDLLRRCRQAFVLHASARAHASADNSATRATDFITNAGPRPAPGGLRPHCIKLRYGCGAGCIRRQLHELRKMRGILNPKRKIPERLATLHMCFQPLRCFRHHNTD